MVIWVVGGQPFGMGRPEQLIVGGEETKLTSRRAQRLRIIERRGQLDGIVATQNVLKHQMRSQINNRLSHGQDEVLVLFDMAIKFPHASI